MTTLKLAGGADGFVQNKDYAKRLRQEEILPLAESRRQFSIDFREVRLSTQSFIHALISEPLRIHGPDLLDRMELLNCNDLVKELVLTVVDYSLNPTV